MRSFVAISVVLTAALAGCGDGAGKSDGPRAGAPAPKTAAPGTTPPAGGPATGEATPGTGSGGQPVAPPANPRIQPPPVDAPVTGPTKCKDLVDKQTVTIALDPSYDWIGKKTYVALSVSDPGTPSHFAPQAPLLGGGVGGGKLTFDLMTTGCDKAVHLIVKGSLAEPTAPVCESRFEYTAVPKMTRIVLMAPIVSQGSCTIPAQAF